MRKFGRRPEPAPTVGNPPDALECDDRLVYDAEAMDEYIARLQTRIAVLEAELAARPAAHRLRARMDLIRHLHASGAVDRREAPFTWLEDAPPVSTDVDFWERRYADDEFLEEMANS